MCTVGLYFEIENVRQLVYSSFLIEFRVFFYNFRKCLNNTRYGLDPAPDLDPDPELQKFVAGSGSGINHSGSTTLVTSTTV